MLNDIKENMSAKKGLTPEVETQGADAEECFVIMPISDQPNYEAGHFGKVYEDIFKPACIAAGYRPTRADEVKQSNLIHLDILKRVVNSPMAICDLSSRNPNVMFELGLRQAFDKPTVLVKDHETLEIFDIAPIRYTNYRQALRYREVLADQEAITNAIQSTRTEIGKKDNVNSLIRLLELSAPAKVSPRDADAEPREFFQILLAEITQLKRQLRFAPPAISATSESTEIQHTGGPSRIGRLREMRGFIEKRMSEGSKFSDVTTLVDEAIAFGKRSVEIYAKLEGTRSGAMARLAKEEVDALEILQILG